jgi:predicted nucleotidyltransferase
MEVPLLTDDFKEFLRSLNAADVEYLVVGAYAVGYHGYPRATVDLDVWVRPELKNAERVVQALRAFGLESTAPDPKVLLSPRALVRFGLPPFRIEIMTTIDGVEFDPCYARAVRADLDGVRVPLISLADLKVNKRAAGRHKDLNDLENLP